MTSWLSRDAKNDRYAASPLASDEFATISSTSCFAWVCGFDYAALQRHG